jgi:hypothetical protein
MQSERAQWGCCVRERINAQSTGEGLRPCQNVRPTDSMTEAPQKAGAARRPLPDPLSEARQGSHRETGNQTRGCEEAMGKGAAAHPAPHILILS